MIVNSACSTHVIPEQALDSLTWRQPWCDPTNLLTNTSYLLLNSSVSIARSFTKVPRTGMPFSSLTVLLGSRYAAAMTSYLSW
jgi:hypothetical protein